MMLESTTTAKSSTWKGTTFHFCSSECKEKFDAEPAEYAGGRKHKGN
jgi:YHS domain-containing protein